MVKTNKLDLRILEHAEKLNVKLINGSKISYWDKPKKEKIPATSKFASHPNYFGSDNESEVGILASRRANNFKASHSDVEVTLSELNNYIRSSEMEHKLKPKMTRTLDIVSNSNGSIDSSSAETININSRYNSGYLNDELQLRSILKSCPEKGVSHDETVLLSKSNQKQRPSKDSKSISENQTKVTASKLHNRKPRTDNNFYMDCQKLLKLVEKSSKLIDTIDQELKSGIEPPDGTEDFERRKKRSAEFASRFSRYYLYTLERHKADLLKLTSSGLHTFRTKTQTVSKIASANQIILQALQAYLKHLPFSLPNCYHLKLQDLLKDGLEISKNCSNFFNSCPLICDESKHLIYSFEKQLEEFLGKLKRRDIDQLDNVNISMAGTKTSLCSTKGINHSLKKKKPVACKYSMYRESLVNKDTPWKSALQKLVRQKMKYSHVKSRYKVVTAKEKSSEEKFNINKFPPLDRKSSHVMRNTPVTSPICEDKITTMIEMEKEMEKTDDSNCVKESKTISGPLQNNNKTEGLISNIEQLVQTISDSNTKMQTQFLLNKITSILENIRNDENNSADITEDKANECLQNIVQQLQEYCISKESKNENKLGSENEDDKSKFNEKSANDQKTGVQPTKTEQKEVSASNDQAKVVCVTGPQNAKLICIRDYRLPRDCSPLDKPAKEEGPQKEKRITSSNLDQEKQNSNESKLSSKGSKVKISRLPKRSLRQLDLLPKSKVVNIVKYKLDYSKFSKCKCMYRKSSKIRPWVLLHRVSDKLLDEILLSIVKEIQMPGLLENLYLSEFQQ